MTRRVAAFDVGSNSVLCLIAEETAPGHFQILRDISTVTGLGRGLTDAGLHTDSKTRTWETLERYRNILDEMQVTECYAVATAAMRDGRDGPAFADRIRTELKIPVRVISGLEEAELTWLSVVRTFRPSGPMTMVDIGGRSTELMQGQEGMLNHRVSLGIGSVSATEQFIKGDPATPESLESLRVHSREMLREVPGVAGEVTLFGVAATVTSYAALVMGMTTYNRRQVQGFRLKRDALSDQVQRLASMTLAERLVLPGLEPKRADVLVAGGVVLLECMAHYDVSSLVVSDVGLRHGVLLSALGLVVLEEAPL